MFFAYKEICFLDDSMQHVEREMIIVYYSYSQWYCISFKDINNLYSFQMFPQRQRPGSFFDDYSYFTQMLHNLYYVK